jgi:phosphohistidine phosphatase SixA
MQAAAMRVLDGTEIKVIGKRIQISVLLLGIFSGHCLGQSATGLVFLVRHAEKASDAKDALLSEAGHKRAECLAHFLETANIRKILVTPVVRTQQTAEPLAKASGLKPTVLDADDIDAFVNNLRAEPNANVLVVAHSDTIPKIIEQLAGGQIPSIEGSEYDKIFVVHPEANGKRGSVVTLQYCDCK